MRLELIFKNIEFLNVIDLVNYSKDGIYINEKKSCQIQVSLFVFKCLTVV